MVTTRAAAVKRWLLLLVALALALAWIGWLLQRRTHRSTKPSPSAVTTTLATAVSTDAGVVPTWPSGTHVQVSLPAEPGAVSMIKQLFRDGDVVLDQTWPDGSHERWWYPADGAPHYIDRRGKETVGERTP